MHFLAHCSNYWKPIKKSSEGCPFKQVSAAATTSASEETWRPFNSFSIQGTGVGPTGPDPVVGRVVSILETQVGQFLLGFKCPVRRDIVVQWQDNPSHGVFSSKCLSISPAEMSYTPHWYFGFLKAINEEYAVLIPPKKRRELFQPIFALGIFLGMAWRHKTFSPRIVTLSPGNGNITRFRPWSAIATTNLLDLHSRKNSKSCSDDWHRWRWDISGPTSWRASTCLNLHDWWTQPAHVWCPFARLLN